MLLPEAVRDLASQVLQVCHVAPLCAFLNFSDSVPLEMGPTFAVFDWLEVRPAQMSKDMTAKAAKSLHKFAYTGRLRFCHPQSLPDARNALDDKGQRHEENEQTLEPNVTDDVLENLIVEADGVLFVEMRVTFATCVNLSSLKDICNNVTEQGCANNQQHRLRFARIQEWAQLCAIILGLGPVPVQPPD